MYSGSRVCALCGLCLLRITQGVAWDPIGRFIASIGEDNRLLVRFLLACLHGTAVHLSIDSCSRPLRGILGLLFWHRRRNRKQLMLFAHFSVCKRRVVDCRAVMAQCDTQADLLRSPRQPCRPGSPAVEYCIFATHKPKGNDQRRPFFCFLFIGFR